MTEATTTETTTTTDPAAGQQATEPTTPTTPVEGAANDLPDWAKDPAAALKMVTDLRAENARTRTSAKEAAAQEARDALLEQLGLKPKDSPVDPEQVKRDLASKDATIRDLQVKGALQDALAAAQAKPIARAAVLGEGLLNDLDPSSVTFQADVASRVSDYISKNPELKATTRQVPSSSGGDRPAGDAAKPVFTRAQLRNFEFYQANKAAIDLASAEGRITD